MIWQENKIVIFLKRFTKPLYILYSSAGILAGYFFSFHFFQEPSSQQMATNPTSFKHEYYSLLPGTEVMFQSEYESASETATRNERTGSEFEEVDSLIEKLKNANIIYNLPPDQALEMELEQTLVVELKLSLNMELEELSRTFPTQETDLSYASVLSSRNMQAHLTGSKIEVTPITAEDQAITSSGITRWAWIIEPEMEGKHVLHLSLTARLKTIDGMEVNRTIETFRRKINVYVSFNHEIRDFLSAHLAWIISAVFSPFFVWAGSSVWNRARKHISRK